MKIEGTAIHSVNGVPTSGRVLIHGRVFRVPVWLVKLLRMVGHG
jgi:hypothetical protein